MTVPRTRPPFTNITTSSSAAWAGDAEARSSARAATVVAIRFMGGSADRGGANGEGRFGRCSETVRTYRNPVRAATFRDAGSMEQSVCQPSTRRRDKDLDHLERAITTDRRRVTAARRHRGSPRRLWMPRASTLPASRLHGSQANGIESLRVHPAASKANCMVEPLINAVSVPVAPVVVEVVSTNVAELATTSD